MDTENIENVQFASKDIPYSIYESSHSNQGTQKYIFVMIGQMLKEIDYVLLNDIKMIFSAWAVNAFLKSYHNKAHIKISRNIEAVL